MRHDNTKVSIITIIAVIAVVGLVTLFLGTMEGPTSPELDAAALEEQQAEPIPPEPAQEGATDGS